MTTEDKRMNRPVPLWLVVVISICTFLLGAVAGILFCDHYAHDPLGTISSIGTTQKGDVGRIKVLEEQVKNDPADVRAWTALGNLYFWITPNWICLAGLRSPGSAPIGSNSKSRG